MIVYTFIGNGSHRTKPSIWSLIGSLKFYHWKNIAVCWEVKISEENCTKMWNIPNALHDSFFCVKNVIDSTQNIWKLHIIIKIRFNLFPLRFSKNDINIWKDNIQVIWKKKEFTSLDPNQFIIFLFDEIRIK